MGTDAGTGAAKYIATGTIPASSNADDIATAMMTAINSDAHTSCYYDSTGSNVFKVTRSVSGTATTDMSP